MVEVAKSKFMNTYLESKTFIQWKKMLLFDRLSVGITFLGYPVLRNEIFSEVFTVLHNLRHLKMHFYT